MTSEVPGEHEFEVGHCSTCNRAPPSLPYPWPQSRPLPHLGCPAFLSRAQEWLPRSKMASPRSRKAWPSKWEIRSPNLSRDRQLRAQGTPTWNFFPFYGDASGFLGPWPIPKGKSPPSLPMGHSRPKFTTQMGKLAPGSVSLSYQPRLGSSPRQLLGKLHPVSSGLTSPSPGELRSSCLEICEGVVSSWASCNPAEYFPGYLTKLLQNHTAYACDGDHLNLQCPRHSTISVQSAFYGQDYQMCSTQQPASQREDSLTCVAPTTLQVLSFVDVLG